MRTPLWEEEDDEEKKDQGSSLGDQIWYVERDWDWDWGDWRWIEWSFLKPALHS